MVRMSAVKGHEGEVGAEDISQKMIDIHVCPGRATKPLILTGDCSHMRFSAGSSSSSSSLSSTEWFDASDEMWMMAWWHLLEIFGSTNEGRGSHQSIFASAFVCASAPMDLTSICKTKIHHCDTWNIELYERPEATQICFGVKFDVHPSKWKYRRRWAMPSNSNVVECAG